MLRRMKRSFSGDIKRNWSAVLSLLLQARSFQSKATCQARTNSCEEPKKGFRAKLDDSKQTSACQQEGEESNCSASLQSPQAKVFAESTA